MTLETMPIGTGYSIRNGQATVNVTRTSADSIEVTATCDSLTRQVLLLTEELTRVRNDTSAEQPPPKVVREPTGWQWAQIWAGRIAVFVLLTTGIKRRLKHN